MKRALSKAVQSVMPPLIWNVYLRTRRLGQIYPWVQFRNMGTSANAAPLFEGRFAEIHERYRGLDPFVGDVYRYLHYNICFFGSLCRHVAGDFVCAGVSFGATPRVVFDYVEFPTLGKTLHLIDPFEGIVGDDSSRIAVNYNCDPDYVLRQYPPGASIVLHRKRIPLRLPGPLAFVFIDTGNATANAMSLPIFYEALSPGGIIICDDYSNNIEQFKPVLEPLGITPFWLPSGQGVIVKQ